MEINALHMMSRSIATPGSLKQKTDDVWNSRHYITLSLVTGVVILTSLAGYKLLKQHTNTFGPSPIALPKK